MKKIILTIAIVLGGLGLFAQPTPPPSGANGGHGQNGNQPGGGAPIDGGFSILLAMGAIYGANKVYQMKKAEE